MAEEHTLVVDRSLQNNHFSNWRLGAQFVKHKAQLQLPGPVATPGDQDAVDYIHTRASVLHNHLLESRGQLFVCCAEPAPSHAIAVHHLSLHASAADPHGSLRQLAGERSVAGRAAPGQQAYGGSTLQGVLRSSCSCPSPLSTHYKTPAWHPPCCTQCWNQQQVQLQAACGPRSPGWTAPLQWCSLKQQPATVVTAVQMILMCCCPQGQGT